MHRVQAGARPVQVSTLEEGELFGAEAFFGVSGADYASQQLRSSPGRDPASGSATSSDADAVAMPPPSPASDSKASRLRGALKRRRGSNPTPGVDSDAADSGNHGNVLPYSVVCMSPRVVLTTIRGAELHSLLAADPALRQRLLRYAAVGMSRRVQRISSFALEQAFVKMNQQSK